MAYSRSCIPAFLDRSWWEAFDYPSVVWDQHFGTVLSEDDLYPSALYQGFALRSRTRAVLRSSGESDVTNDKEAFAVKLSVKHFKLNELEVKICSNHIVINGQHGEQSDDNGIIERKFSRQYVLPEDSNSEAIKCCLNNDGFLFIEVPKVPSSFKPSEDKDIEITLLETYDKKAKEAKDSKVEKISLEVAGDESKVENISAEVDEHKSKLKMFAEVSVAEPKEVTSFAESNGAEPKEVTSFAESNGAEPKEVTSLAEGNGAEPKEVTSFAEGNGAKPKEVTSFAESNGVKPKEVNIAKSAGKKPKEVDNIPKSAAVKSKEP